MYVFISYSSTDKVLARRLADSLSLYAVPVFLDERQILIGDSIPARIYEALERATHVMYLVSSSSIQSRWVQEELSVAKTRQMQARGCRILPILIEDVSIPASLTHIKYADFRNWSLKEVYTEGVLNILAALGIEPLQVAGSSDLAVFFQCISELILVKAFADSMTQVCFQLERLWFYLFKQNPSELSWWFFESANKEPHLNEPKVGSAWAEIKARFNAYKIAPGTQWEELQNRYSKVITDWQYFYDAPKYHSTISTDQGEEVYKRIWRAEVNANDLSAAIGAILVEMVQFMGPRPARNNESNLGGK